MSEELEVLKEVTERLDLAKITYLVSGSIAANYYTIPRMTRDIDIVVEMKEKDISRFIQFFKNDFFVDEEMIEREVRTNGMFNLIHSKYVIKIDFILRKVSIWQSGMFARRQKITVGDYPVWIISLEDLILAKLVWAKDSLSELQLGDVRHLLGSSKTIDRPYLAKWVKDLNIESVYSRAAK